jgi:alpha-tubulin suppressor-like RCC1 family protein
MPQTRSGPNRVHAWLQVAIGYSHMLALTDEGRVYSWGHNFYGQLGVGDHKDKASPQLISYLQEDRITQVAGKHRGLPSGFLPRLGV